MCSICARAIASYIKQRSHSHLVRGWGHSNTFGLQTMRELQVLRVYMYLWIHCPWSTIHWNICVILVVPRGTTRSWHRCSARSGKAICRLQARGLVDFRVNIHAKHCRRSGKLVHEAQTGVWAP